jgi:hypothetical protein
MKVAGQAYQVGGLTSAAQPAAQCLVRGLRPDGVAEPECVDDAARRVVQAKGARVVQLYLSAPDIEGGGAGSRYTLLPIWPGAGTGGASLRRQLLLPPRTARRGAALSMGRVDVLGRRAGPACRARLIAGRG